MKVAMRKLALRVNAMFKQVRSCLWYVGENYASKLCQQKENLMDSNKKGNIFGSKGFRDI